MDSSRQIVVFGAGVLGQRIAAVFIAGGFSVNLVDLNKEALAKAQDYIRDNISKFSELTPEKQEPGPFAMYLVDELSAAVSNAWLVVEVVPEILDLKISTFKQLDSLAPNDCIFASNSSSYKSRLMVQELSQERQEKTLNMHFVVPPGINTVELMTDGETQPKLFELLSNVLKTCGMIPITAKKESTG